MNPPARNMHHDSSDSSIRSTKRRSRGETPRNELLFQINHSCAHTGRYIASTKRRINWRFGLLKAHGVLVEAHEIELLWSVKSGKAQICWNGNDISHLFKDRMPKKTASAIEFKWRANNGMKIMVVANINPPPRGPQYDCFMNGASYLSLPSRFEFESKLLQEHPGIPRLPSREAPSCSGRTLSGGSGDRMSEDEDNPATIHQSQNRLVAAGFAPYQYQMEDELRSELYSSTLDILRDEVAASVPETEEIMSRAIIAAFSQDHDSDGSYDSVSELSDRNCLDSSDIEADVLGAAVEWLCWSSRFVAPMDMQERKLEFMQRYVEKMVSHVRHERLSPHAASKIMVLLATLLNLQVTKTPARDTVIVSELGQFATTQDLLDAMHSYGEVDQAAISRRHDGIGFCRFRSESAAARACESSRRKETRKLGGAQFRIFDPTQRSHVAQMMEMQPESQADDDYSVRHQIDPGDDAIEATYCSRQTGSLTQQELSSYCSTNALDSSVSSQFLPYKQMSSNVTVSTMSLDMDEVDNRSRSTSYASIYYEV